MEARMRRRRSILGPALVVGLLIAASASEARAEGEADAGADEEQPVERALDLGGPALVLRRIPKGSFVQGSPSIEAGRKADEAPRPVAISHAFWMGKHAVTRRQFARFASDARYVTEAEKGQSGGFGWDGTRLVHKKEYTWRDPGFSQTDDDPVVLVTFGDANAFAAWASRKTGERVRLPTEAEWEYAARAGTTTPWYSGTNEQDALVSGWLEPNAGRATHPVGRKGANAFGLFDMVGNVYEWCRDVYAPYPPGRVVDPEQISRVGAAPEERVLRGGSWLADPERARSAARWRSPPGGRSAERGFRLVVAPDDALLGGGLAGIDPTGEKPAPLGLDGTPAAPAPEPASSADAAESASPPPQANRSSAWLLFVAPAGAAAAVVLWILARRRPLRDG